MAERRACAPMIAESSNKKQPYEKPSLSVVKFAVEEAVFTNCKIAEQGRGPGYPSWITGCTGSGWGGYACYAPGS